MVYSLFAPEITGGSLVIAISVIGLSLALWQNSRVGSTTVQLWQSRAEGLDEQLKDAVDNVHQAELHMKDREAEIAELRARPDTEKVYQLTQAQHELVQRQHSEIISVLSRLAATQEAQVETSVEAMKILTVLADRHREIRSTDHIPPEGQS